MHVLFVCSRNRRRSPTAERVFAEHGDLGVVSAGLAPDAEERVTGEMLQWADVVLVMEPAHRRRLLGMFGRALRDVRVHCLNIPDNYEFMDPKLIQRLQRDVPGLLRRRA